MAVVLDWHRLCSNPIDSRWRYLVISQSNASCTIGWARLKMLVASSRRHSEARRQGDVSDAETACENRRPRGHARLSEPKAGCVLVMPVVGHHGVIVKKTWLLSIPVGRSAHQASYEPTGPLKLGVEGNAPDESMPVAPKGPVVVPFTM